MQFDNLEQVSYAQLKDAKNWQAQYRLITDWGKCIAMKPELRIENNLIKGCEVSAWLVHQIKNGEHYFLFDSDSRVINGLAAVLLSIMNGNSSHQFNQLDFVQLLSAAGLEKHLTPSRNNGVKAIIARACELVNAAVILNK